MDRKGLALCCRYCFPPNSYHLCGPEKQSDLGWYTATQIVDRGTSEILSQFSTLYPYLVLIAGANGIKNPFHPKVVEAYWVGNELLTYVSTRHFIMHLENSILLKKLLSRRDRNLTYQKVALGGLPHHSYHVFNIFKRTGNITNIHTLQTMEACIIGWGKVIKITSTFLLIKTIQLNISKGKLIFGNTIFRKIFFPQSKDIMKKNLQIGDWISYHWGTFCQKLNSIQLHNLIYYTNISLRIANL